MSRCSRDVVPALPDRLRRSGSGGAPVPARERNPDRKSVVSVNRKGRRRVSRSVAGTLAILAALIGAGVPQRGAAVDQDSGIVVRADRIEVQGLLPSLAMGGDGGLVIRLRIHRATAYGLRVIGNQSQTSAGFPWGMRIDSTGPAVLEGLLADTTALGLRGAGLKLDVPFPQLTLRDVFLRCTRLTAGHVFMPSMKLHTDKGIEDSGTAPIIDLRSLTVINGEGVVDLLNGLLSGDSSGAGGQAKGEAPSGPQRDGGKEAEASRNPEAGSAETTSGSVETGSGRGEVPEPHLPASDRSEPPSGGMEPPSGAVQSNPPSSVQPNSETTGRPSGAPIAPFSGLLRQLGQLDPSGFLTSSGTSPGFGSAGSSQSPEAVPER